MYLSRDISLHEKTGCTHFEACPPKLKILRKCVGWKQTKQKTIGQRPSLFSTLLCFPCSDPRTTPSTQLRGFEYKELRGAGRGGASIENKIQSDFEVH